MVEQEYGMKYYETRDETLFGIDEIRDGILFGLDYTWTPKGTLPTLSTSHYIETENYVTIRTQCLTVHNFI